MARKLKSRRNGAVYGFSEKLVATGNFTIIDDGKPEPEAIGVETNADDGVAIAPAAIPTPEPPTRQAKTKAKGGKAAAAKKPAAAATAPTAIAETTVNDELGEVHDPLLDAQ